MYWMIFTIPRRIVCNNEAVKAKIVEYGVDPDKIVPIPAFSTQYVERDPVSLPDDVAEFYARFPQVVLTYIRFREGFYIDTMIEGFAIAAARVPTLGLAVCGRSGDIEESLLADLQARIDRHGLGDRVYMIDDLTHAEFLEALSASVLYLRTPTTDGVASSVLESLALRVPVVGSQNGTRPDGVVTYTATDPADLAAKVLDVAQNHERVVASLPRPDVRDTLADEVALLTR